MRQSGLLLGSPGLFQLFTLLLVLLLSPVRLASGFLLPALLFHLPLLLSRIFIRPPRLLLQLQLFVSLLPSTISLFTLLLPKLLMLDRTALPVKLPLQLVQVVALIGIALLIGQLIQMLTTVQFGLLITAPGIGLILCLRLISPFRLVSGRQLWLLPMLLPW